MSLNTGTAVGLFEKGIIVGSRSVAGNLGLGAIGFRWGSKLGQEILILAVERKQVLLTPSTPQLEEGSKVLYIMATAVSTADILLHIG
jgi:hypothetical protein